MTQTRQIQVGPQLIYHMIEGQAGTLGKALLEFIMNSIDAGASQVTIALDTDSFTVTDDGKGVTRLDDVEECLATLGFDHGDNNERTYGKFGIGRSQAWAFAPTTMRTGTFEMNVDIRQWGLDYELANDLPEAEGFTVSGRFYDAMTPSDVDRTERELKDLAAYAQIPVILNGRTISRLPQSEKWDVETDQCYIRFQERGDLSVYNLGVLVRHYPSHLYGTGGVVVSKKELAVNFARNDVLEAKCAIWKEVRRFIREQAGQRTRRQPSLNDTEREFLLAQLKSGEICGQDDGIENLRLIQDVTGKRHTLKRLRTLSLVTFCTEQDRRLATRVHEKKLAFVLHPSMLHMLNAETVDEVRDALTAIVFQPKYNHSWFRGEVKAFDDFRDAFDEGHDPLDTNKDLTKVEKCAVRAMNKVNDVIRYGFYSATNEYITPRKIILGVSQTAEAWTDGKTYVAIERSRAKLLREGLAGATQLAALLVHEYCHQSGDLSGHGHPPEFFETFHEVTLNSHGTGCIAHYLLKTYATELKKAGLKPTRAMLDSDDADHMASRTVEAQTA